MTILDLRLDVRTLAAGQPRPYADTFYTYRLTFSRPNSEKLDWKPGEDQVRRYCMALRPSAKWEKCDDWWAEKVEYLEQISDNVWEFSTRRRYDD